MIILLIAISVHPSLSSFVCSYSCIKSSLQNEANMNLGTHCFLAIHIFCLVLCLHLVIELFLCELLSLYISSAGRPNVKYSLQLKFFLAEHDKPYFQENIKDGVFHYLPHLK